MHPGWIIDVPGSGEHPAGTGPDLSGLEAHVALLLVEVPSPVGLPVDRGRVRADSAIGVSGAPTDPVRHAYASSVDAFLTTAARVGADRWSRPATGEWTVLELFAHTVRDMAVIGAFLDADLPRPDVVLPDAAALRLPDYLGTRATELVLHTLDLQLACGLDLSVPTDALALVDRILVDLADRADPVGLALALSGRSGPRGADVLG